MDDRGIARGERVFIRYPTAEDERAFLRAVAASRELHRPWTFLPETADGFRDLLDRTRDPADELLLICLLQDGSPTGVAHLGQIVLRDFRSAYLGYSAFVPHEGKGLMREGLALVLRHAFETIGLHRVEANIQPENARSIALVERLGFRREGYSPRYLRIGGEWRDHVRYAILAEDVDASG
ncbi:MAG TPA: GNAT family N-acetyltransferase [Actinomycetota bacterium]|nr:GNAT family N-acetyltransferase [Actinomycetota bacterium]